MRSGRFALHLEKLDCSASADEVHDDRDDGEDEEQVDQKSGDMEDGETTDPENDEDDCENEEHRKPTFMTEVVAFSTTRLPAGDSAYSS